MSDKSWIAEAANRDDWLSQVIEEPLSPDMEIVDPHHHLWDRAGTVYELDQLHRDTDSGHNVVQTVFIECHSGYDDTAAPAFQPVGETKYVVDIANQAKQHPEKAQIAGIIAHADLRGGELSAVLDAHADAGLGLFKGIRHAGAFDPEPQALKIQSRSDDGLYLNPAFQKGMAELGARGLTYDTWHYHHQNRDFLELAQAVPETTMVLDHFGTPLGVGRFAGQRDEIFKAWRDDVAAIAQCPNVIAKLGGLAMPDNGWGWHDRAKPPTSDEFVETQGDWYRHMIACFGADRCMFESNFPVDRASISYNVMWNGMKKIAAEYSTEEQKTMFAGTARRVYSL